MQKGERYQKIQELLQSNKGLKEEIEKLEKRNLPKNIFGAELKKLAAQYGAEAVKESVEESVEESLKASACELNDDDLSEVAGGGVVNPIGQHSCGSTSCNKNQNGKCFCPSYGVDCWFC